MIAAPSLWWGSEWPAASALPEPARGCLSPSKARSGSCPWLATPSLRTFFSQHTELLWVELHPQRNDTLKPYPPATVKVTALGDRSLCRWSPGEVSRVGPDPTRLVSLKNGDRWREGQTRTEGRWGEDGGATTEAETGVMRLQAKDTEDCWEGFSSRAGRGHGYLGNLTLDSQPPELRDDAFLLFQASQATVLGYSSRRKPLGQHRVTQSTLTSPALPAATHRRSW